MSAGVAWSQDDIDPVGGAPLPLAQMLDVGDSSNKRGSDSKDVLDLLLGVTQVLESHDGAARQLLLQRLRAAISTIRTRS